jgi:nitrite reductase/ring-hydroxylating ferredoxin subunit
MKLIIIEIKVLLGLGKWYRVFNSFDDAITSIPNQKSILVHLGKTEICLARNEQKIDAFINECPHHQMPLNKGKYNEKQEWICPYHRHCFNLHNGQNMTMNQSRKLTLFSVKANKKGLFVYKPNPQ